MHRQESKPERLKTIPNLRIPACAGMTKKQASICPEGS
ncbi:hypothetical protein F528_0891 [Neisseria meningitidis 992008]|nr:hypothetical protein F528_0891 [Neisseria meningitidis 992008]